MAGEDKDAVHSSLPKNFLTKKFQLRTSIVFARKGKREGEKKVTIQITSFGVRFCVGVYVWNSIELLNTSFGSSSVFDVSGMVSRNLSTPCLTLLMYLSVGSLIYFGCRSLSGKMLRRLVKEVSTLYGADPIRGF